MSCLESVESAIDDLHSDHGEYVDFFGEVFDQFESLMLELFAQHKWVESRIQYQAEQQAAGAESERQFRACLKDLRELEARVRSAHEGIARIWPEISSAYPKFLEEHAELRETREEMRKISAELCTVREGIEQDRIELRQRQDSIQEHLQRLAGILADSAAAPSPSGRDEQLAQILEAVRDQQAAWQQDRARLESELQAERQRAAQQDEALAEQRRLAAQQQAELDGQLKRMRSLTEVLSDNMKQPFGAHSDDGSRTSSENAALASAFSQFQTLLREHAQRRADRGKEENTAKR